ncbi:UvrD-helicase domain-containing protein [Psychrobacter sp. AOP30-A2-5]|uniref:UvrD-helicase domain-containing protein n=1 Tax=Psychrobacter sp. AOP30-A2-5 TaxID=3457697 RepID=UPI004035FD45
MLITDEDINYAEKLLLVDGQSFDEERRDFIKNMQTIDLQAVPGSGKTTALLAKLVILETKLPLEGGVGILVLSHTNAAIDEIKHRIQSYCPKLFAYPNFIGTIQSFVDTFLAIPYYSNIFKRKISRLDNEIYEEFALRRYSKLKNINYSTFNWLKRKNDPEKYFLNLRFDKDLNLVEGLHGNVCLQNKNEKSSQSYLCLRDIKIDILRSGCLHFDDAYIIAEDAIMSTGILEILQKRFPFVFVDEMQDMGQHQYELIEKLFHRNNCDCILQRVGDINQAIYNLGKSDANSIWQQREPTLPLANSHRLSPNISNIVNRLAVNAVDYAVQGNNHSALLRPHILCFNNETIKKVIPFFSRLVHQYYNEEKLPNFGRKPIKAIAWSVNWKEDEASRNDISRLRLEDYFTSFDVNTNSPKIDYKCLKEYLTHHLKDTNTLAPIRKNILNAFIKILRIENIKDNSPNNSMFYTKRKLLNKIKDENEELYAKFKLKLYQWSVGVVKGDIDDVLVNIQSFVPELLEFFECSVNKCQRFITDEDIREVEGIEIIAQSNSYYEDGFEIDITSVHSAKGQTHCATLYLESYYHGYEAKKLKNFFLGGEIDLSKSRQVEASKMMYVGFSRPMDLLCFAVHEDRLNDLRESLGNDWEIINMFSES